MKLGSLIEGRDGSLVVVSGDNRRFVRAHDVAPTLQAALEDWAHAAPRLQGLSSALDTKRTVGEPVVWSAFAPALPRAYEWLDGSAFLAHVRRVRRARGAEPPAELERDPLMYQGSGGRFLAAHEGFLLPDETWGLDFEAELAVLTTDVARGTPPEAARHDIALYALVNDWTYRGLVPAELSKGFGFVQSKPQTTMAPLAVTPDELSPHLQDERLTLPVHVDVNGTETGRCQAGEMHFSFSQLIAHAARTRPLCAGTVIGSGTVANENEQAGVSCLVERRAIETLKLGKPVSRYLVPGDRVQIAVTHPTRGDVFGPMDQLVLAPTPGQKAQ